jgi:capsular exopolysaccharide synthesis family protein
VAINEQLATIKAEMREEISGLIAGTQSELNQITQIEKGMRSALDRANRLGIELNLQEITYRGLQRERDNTAKLYGTLLERTAQTDLTRALQMAFVRVVDDALVPRIPVSPRVQMALVLGGTLGLLLGLGIALTLEQLDRTVRGVEEAEALGVTILGVMPHIDDGGQLQNVVYGRRKRRQAAAQLINRDLVVHTHPKSTVAECCRTIRTNLTFMSTDTPRKTIVVTSAGPREGKTTVAMSLAISLAQSGKRVLIVDTDLRKPRLHRALGVSLSKGITTVLVGEHRLAEAIQTTSIQNLSLLASGPIPPNPSELLHTVQFRQLLDDLRPMFDQVIFDSPPLAAVTDAAIIAPQVDGVILVVHSERTTRDALRTALRQIRDVRSQLTGGVLNEVDLSGHAYGYSSYYYYHNEGYYEANPDKDDDGNDGKPPSRPVAQA